LLIQQNDLLISLTFLPFETGFFEWQRKKFKHNRLLEMEVIALSSELAAFIILECLEKKGTFSIAQFVMYKVQYGLERLARLF